MVGYQAVVRLYGVTVTVVRVSLDQIRFAVRRVGFSRVSFAGVSFGGRLEVIVRCVRSSASVMFNLRMVLFMVGVIPSVVRVSPFLVQVRLLVVVPYRFVMVVKGFGVAWLRMDLPWSPVGDPFLYVE